MGFHNTNEDIVIAKVNAIFDFIKKNNNPENICLCDQCRIDTTCYVLNRIEPYYVVSNRGIARVKQHTLADQQKEMDIMALAYKGIRQINLRTRHGFGNHTNLDNNSVVLDEPVFNFPIISGRIFNGLNFAPMKDVIIELSYEGSLIPMVDSNWQNPYTLVAQTRGIFAFWPNTLSADSIDIQKKIGFSIMATKTDFEILYHCFQIPVISERHRINTFSMKKSIRLPDLYMFPPAEEEVHFCCSLENN